MSLIYDADGNTKFVRTSLTIGVPSSIVHTGFNFTNVSCPRHRVQVPEGGKMFDLEKKSAKLPDDNLTKSDYGALTLQRIIDLGRFLLTSEHSYS